MRQTSYQTIGLIKAIKELMLLYKYEIRKLDKTIYSQDLINNLFRHPYTKIAFLEQELQVHRHTATRYLNKLTETGFLERIKIKNDVYFLNTKLFNLLHNVGESKLSEVTS